MNDQDASWIQKAGASVQGRLGGEHPGGVKPGLIPKAGGTAESGLGPITRRKSHLNGETI